MLAVAAVEALGGAGGHVAGAGAGGEVLLHVAEAEDDLAAHAHRVAVLDAGGDALHAGDVLGDALADVAVAAGDGVDHLAVAVDDLDGDAVELLGDEEVGRDGTHAVLRQELLAPGEPRVELVGGDGLVERPHGDLVPRLRPLVHQLARAHPREDGVGGVEGAEVVLEGVVGGVGDLRVAGVVAGAVLLEPAAQLVGAGAEGGIEVEAAVGAVVGGLRGLGGSPVVRGVAHVTPAPRRRRRARRRACRPSAWRGSRGARLRGRGAPRGSRGGCGGTRWARRSGRGRPR